MKSAKCLIAIIILANFAAMAQLNITVMTYNIFGGKGADGIVDDEDIPRLGRVISAQSPDLLGIQESWEEHATELGALAKLDNVEWAAPGNVGEALLSKFAIKNVKEILLPPDESRMLIFSEVEVTSSTGATETIIFITTHFVYNDDAAKLESAKIVDSVFNGHYDNKQPALFTGDLNSKIGSDPVNYLDQSWEIEDFSFNIDWVMYRPAERWEVVSIAEIDTGEALQASDHKPIVMKLEYQFQTGIIQEYQEYKYDQLSHSSSSSSIHFKLHVDQTSKITIKIFNPLGQEVRTLANRVFSRGLHTITWNRRDNYGIGVSSGLYLYTLQLNGKFRDPDLAQFLLSQIYIQV
jgi:endonuclease/exonuclease/phosphatase family metal-dependent hydrolase